MAETLVVHVREPFDVYIGRAGNGKTGYFGNLHPIGICTRCGKTHDRAEAIAAYKRDFWERVNADLEFRQRVQELRGKRLACFCKRPGSPPLACHGDVIVAWLNAGCPLRTTSSPGRVHTSPSLLQNTRRTPDPTETQQTHMDSITRLALEIARRSPTRSHNHFPHLPKDHPDDAPLLPGEPIVNHFVPGGCVKCLTCRGCGKDTETAPPASPRPSGMR